MKKIIPAVEQRGQILETLMQKLKIILHSGKGRMLPNWGLDSLPRAAFPKGRVSPSSFQAYESRCVVKSIGRTRTLIDKDSFQCLKTAFRS